MLLVIFSFIFWQIAVLQGWQMAMLLDKQISIFLVWEMATYPIWQMQILPNFLYVVAHGSSKRTVCVQEMHKSCSHFAYGCSIWNHHACCEKLWFVRSIYPNLPQMGQKIYHGMLMPLHDSMPSFMNFRRVLDLLEFKNQASQCFAGNQRCPGVWNSFPFLAWDLSMHPRTHIWFFNQFICTGACACSSNLNYAHKCIENSVNA